MKKVVLALVVVFLGFWLVTDPRGLAETSSSLGGNLWGLTQQLFASVIAFVGELK